jgi:hypothetical protein
MRARDALQVSSLYFRIFRGIMLSHQMGHDFGV